MRYNRNAFNPKTHVGVDASDCKELALAYQLGKELTIDAYGHVYDETDRWIADAMERGKGAAGE